MASCGTLQAAGSPSLLRSAEESAAPPVVPNQVQIPRARGINNMAAVGRRGPARREQMSLGEVDTLLEKELMSCSCRMAQRQRIENEPLRRPTASARGNHRR